MSQGPAPAREGRHPAKETMGPDEQDIADALLHPGRRDTALARITLRYAVARTILCPYTCQVLDVSNAVLLDGTGHGGTMHIMTADTYDTLIRNAGDISALEEAPAPRQTTRDCKEPPAYEGRAWEQVRDSHGRLAGSEAP